MSIRKRGNAWQIDVTVGGERVRIDFRNHEDAIKAEADLKLASLRSSYAQAKKMIEDRREAALARVTSVVTACHTKAQALLSSTR